MKKLSTLILILSAGVSQAQPITDSFNYSAGTNINGQTSPGGIAWQSHNLSGNDKNVVTAGGLTYADAGYSGMVESGGAMIADSTGAGAPWWSTVSHVSFGYINGLGSTFGSTLYGSFLVRPETAMANHNVYFDAGALIGTGNGDFRAGYYTKNGVYTLTAYDASTNQFSEVNVGKTSTMGVTDLVVFKYEQDLPGTQQRFSIAVNPVFSGSGIVWDASIQSTRSLNLGYRTEIGTSHVDPGAPNQTTFDEVRFGNSLQNVTPVPEPATMLAVGTGIAALLRRRRK